MISWHNAPNYRYNGYRYVPDIDEYDDGVRKAWHNVYRVEDVDPNKDAQHPVLPDFTIDASPYRWLTYDEFTYHVDMMRGDVYGENT